MSKMPPKKASETSDGKFTWEGANETKLLMIMLSRHIGTSEYDEVANAFPGMLPLIESRCATGGAIRNRIGVLRAKQKKVYEELGWELPGGSGATPAKKGKATPSKRAAGDEEGGEAETPTKKPRAPRKKKSATLEKSAEDDEEMGDGAKKEEEIDEV
ncbi:hypothetical protein E8E11_008366 [Didymella keratinophila]|nr:hypothetical protein E8E11_008366 [Didymella keratinophila]